MPSKVAASSALGGHFGVLALSRKISLDTIDIRFGADKAPRHTTPLESMQI
jgi:hypothetical protein